MFKRIFPLLTRIKWMWGKPEMYSEIEYSPFSCVLICESGDWIELQKFPSVQGDLRDCIPEFFI